MPRRVWPILTSAVKGRQGKADFLERMRHAPLSAVKTLPPHREAGGKRTKKDKDGFAHVGGALARRNNSRQGRSYATQRMQAPSFETMTAPPRRV